MLCRPSLLLAPLTRILFEPFFVPSLCLHRPSNTPFLLGPPCISHNPTSSCQFMDPASPNTV